MARFGCTFLVLAASTLLTPPCSSSAGKGADTRLALGKAVENPILVCYYGTWANYRDGRAAFKAEDIDPNLCTHMIYSFFLLDESSYRVKYGDEWLDLGVEGSGTGLGMIARTMKLRDQNPNLKISMAIGGWNEGSIKYSNMVSVPARRQAFISSIIEIIRSQGFDGIDMDWEYPAKRGGAAQDKENFVLLLKELREALDDENRPGKDPLLLTSAFGCGQDTIEAAYDVPEISKYLDYLHLMLYDFKVYIDPSDPGFQLGSNLIGHHSPLHPKSTELDGNKTLSVSFAVQTFLDLGAPPEKLVLGVGAYGKTFTMYNESSHHFYDVAIWGGSAGQYTKENGTNAYYEICQEIMSNRDEWTVAFDTEYEIPYAYSKTKWIGYDNEISAKAKVDYGAELGVGGMMVWSLDFDDFLNDCEGWTRFPIVNAIKDRQQYHQQGLRK